MHGHARECCMGMSGNAWPCTGNVQGECQGMHGHAQEMLKGICFPMHREYSIGMSGNAWSCTGKVKARITVAHACFIVLIYNRADSYCQAEFHVLSCELLRVDHVSAVMCF